MSMVPHQQSGFATNSKYPKILSYPPSYSDNNVYTFTNQDMEVTACSRLELTLTLPEIRGCGKMMYGRNYPFLLVKKFEVLINNPGEDVHQVYDSCDGEELYYRFQTSGVHEYYSNRFGGERDEYCALREGTYNDCVIFPSRDIVIPLSIVNGYCFIFPKTKIEFRIELFDLREIIVFDTVFAEKTLPYALKDFESKAKNIKLNFTNIIEKIPKQQFPIFRNVYTTLEEDGATTLVSKPFRHARELSFLNKVDIFNDPNMKFLIPFGPSLSEKELIKEWSKKILSDLIVVTDKDLRTNAGKAAHGFPSEAVFVKVEDDVACFNQNKCEVSLVNVPDNYSIFYHTNILSFSRRRQIHNVMNISELFKSVRGVYFDNGPIHFMMDDIVSNVSIMHVSIPVNIWNHDYNTADGDLRSKSSKESDFFYKNRFIVGMDILGKDRGFSNVTVSIGRDTLHQSYSATYGSSVFDKRRNNPCLGDRNMYPARIEFLTSQFNDTHLIKADPFINFESFVANISWTNYEDYNPISLYKRKPTLIASHLYLVSHRDEESIISIAEL